MKLLLIFSLLTNFLRVHFILYKWNGIININDIKITREELVFIYESPNNGNFITGSGKTTLEEQYQSNNYIINTCNHSISGGSVVNIRENRNIVSEAAHRVENNNNLLVGQKNVNYWEHRTTIVHLFEWKFNDIANECEQFLSSKGFAGVQTSPVHENVMITSKNRPWWERYQPISYKIVNRSGNEAEFADMVKRCNAVGVRVYVDVVFNHMTANAKSAQGTGGTRITPNERQYPRIPFGPKDFHLPVCRIRNYRNAEEVRNCELLNLHDLNQTSEHVRGKIVEFLNRLIDFGVAGFRIDAAKHMWPEDLKIICSRLNDLCVHCGFPPKSRPFIYHEVIDLGGEGVTKYEYTPIGVVTEFKHSAEIGRAFTGNNPLKYLKNWGPAWGFLNSNDALVFVDNHDNQRGIACGRSTILTYKQAKNYKMATAFMLAHPYGITRIMSSFEFTDPNSSPPQDSNHKIISPDFTDEGLCTNGWVCEHRWREIYNMVAFRNIVQDTNIENWWDNGGQQIAFSRENKGFIAFTLAGDLKQILQTGLPAGIYCDVISGSLTQNICSGKTIIVNEDGTAYIEINQDDFEGVLAIHIGAKLFELIPPTALFIEENKR